MDDRIGDNRFGTGAFHPMVSILIPVYNGANFLREAIDSALNQTYDNIEVIVINDGSQDEGKTEEIALSYGDRIRYYSKPNGGVASALNYGITKMSGEYFSWLSHDDLYMPNKIAAQIKLLAVQDCQDGIVFTGYTTIDAGGVSLENYSLPINVAENVRCLLALDTTYTLNGCTMIVPRNLLLDTEGKFDESLYYTQDYDLWFRLSETHTFLYLDELLVKSRQHSEQDSVRNIAKILPEADRFHAKTIRRLVPEEIYDYIQDRTDRLQQLFDKYASSGYEATPAAILDLLARYCQHYRHKGSEMSVLGIDQPLPYNPKSKLRIVFYSNVWMLGGIERSLAILFQNLCNDYDMILLSQFIDEAVGFPLPEGVTHIHLSAVENVPPSIQIAAVTSALNADIFVGNPNFLMDFIPIYRILKRLSIKTVMDNHNYYFLPFYMKWLYPIMKERKDAFTHADVVLWKTHFSATMCAGNCHHIGVIPPPNSYAPVPPRDTPSQKIILAVGRYTDALKRIDLIFKVFTEIYKRDNEVKLVVVGPQQAMDLIIDEPVGRSLRSILEESGLPDTAYSFEGEQTNVQPYYEKASLFLMTSACEGFGMVLTEAGVYGVPVLVYGTPGLEDIISHGENGYIVRDDEIVLVAEWATVLLNDATEWKRISKNAQKLAKRFEVDKVVAMWKSLFEMLRCTNGDVSLQEYAQFELVPEKVGRDYFSQACKEYEYIIDRLLPQARDYEVRLKEQEQKYIDVCQALITSNQEIKNIQSSLSWRITKPIRWLKKVMRRQKG